MTTKYIQKGKEWVEHNLISRELFHHGVKGMKWGVRKKSSKRNKLIEEEIRSGKISRIVNADKQGRHTMTGHTPGRSYLYGDVKYAQKLVDNLSGTGELVLSRNGEWTHKEKVKSPDIIGEHVDQNGIQTKTNKAMIVYSKTGTHIYPRKEEQ